MSNIASHLQSEVICGHPWHPDNGDGTFSNPIIFADYSDPDVIRVGEDFFLVASSFNCTPGLPILHSRDLVNWTIVNHALKNLPHPRYAEVQPGCGVWAPAIRFHAGQFWIFFPTPDEGIYVITAQHPTAQWSEPWLLLAGKGLIDPCSLWDDDGQAYLVHAYAGSRSGIKHRLQVRPMSPDGKNILGEGQIVFHEPEKHPTLEGPKFHKRNGWYYLSAPAGGVATGWQVILRSRHIYGPYEAKIVLAQGSTAINGPHQGALVDTTKGDWWFVHFQDAGVYGRIIHLQPVRWENDWPLIGINQSANGVGAPVGEFQKPVATGIVSPANPQTSDEFDASKLGLQWQWQANHQPDWFHLEPNRSRLNLLPQFFTGTDFKKIPNVLAQKFPAQTFAVETQLDLDASRVGEEAGLIVLGRNDAALSLQNCTDGSYLVWRVDGELKFQAKLSAPNARLKVSVYSGGVCRFSFSAADQWTHLPETFTAQLGVWIGAKVGIYSIKRLAQPTTGSASFDYFRFLPAE